MIIYRKIRDSKKKRKAKENVPNVLKRNFIAPNTHPLNHECVHSLVLTKAYRDLTCEHKEAFHI